MKTIKAKVHMLPFIEDKHQGLTNNSHLYVTTDEEIKEGDWFLHPKYEKGIKTGLEVIKADSSYFGGYGYDWHFCKKIIATTDPKLTKSKEIQFGNMLMLDTNGDGSYYHYKGETEFSLSREELIQKGLIVPQPTQAFIEAYCKQGGIDEVLVEYHPKGCSYGNIILDDLNGDGSYYGDNNKYEVEISRSRKEVESYGAKFHDSLLKLDNNCIIIHPVEEKMYSRDEILHKLTIKSLREKFHSQSGMFINKQTSYEIIKWIEENL